MVFKIACVTIVAVCAILVQSAPIDTIRLRFKVSARGLPDKDTIGTIDPYVEIFYTEDGKKEEVKVGRSATIQDNENPDWGDVFEFDFVRSKHQRWVFKVYDNDDGREDDKGGIAYVDVADYVDKDQRMNVNLSKKGYLTISSVDPVVPQAGGVVPQTGGVLLTPAPVQTYAHAAQQPAVQYAQVSPDVLNLKFRISARDLPDKDKVGLTDPFVELWYTENGSTKENKFGRTATLTDTKNPDFGETFSFDYDRRKNQKWLFRVYDHDQGREDDSAGKVWIDVNDYVAKGQRVTANLSKKGTLTVTTADTTPVVAPVAPVIVGHQPQPQPQAVQLVPVLTPVQPQAVQLVPAAEVPLRLRFRLSAKGLDDKDVIGTSDPYVKISYKQEDSPSEINIGTTEKKSDTENPSWSDVFDFTYLSSKKPKLHLLVLDEDDGRRDDELGDVWVDVAEYLQKNQNLDVKLKKGTLSIRNA